MESEKLVQWSKQIKDILGKLSSGEISSSAYDTAWVARIPSRENPKEPMFPTCLNWIADHQLSDGSWGESSIEYYHDRIICTLSCIITLKLWESSNDKILNGENYINNNLNNLKKDHHELIGFELLFPSLLEKCKILGLDINYKHEIISKYKDLRAQKLDKIPLSNIYRTKSTISHSLEFLDTEDIDVANLNIQQESNGSFGNSPSATSFILTKAHNIPAENYIRNLLAESGNQVPGVYPIEIFEKAWVLDSLDYLGREFDDYRAPILDYLYNSWDDKDGVSISRSFPYKDLDDSSLVFKILHKNGFDVSSRVFENYRRGDHYVCFPFELNPSVSTYVHFLGALNTLDNSPRIREIKKSILNFLINNKSTEGNWSDKWHVSPYYTTSHLIIELKKAGETEHFRSALHWITKTQNGNGSWGYLTDGSIEETAYVLQALLFIEKETEAQDFMKAIQKGISFLERNLNIYYPALWIDKCLYSTNTITKCLALSVIYNYEANFKK